MLTPRLFLVSLAGWLLAMLALALIPAPWGFYLQVTGTVLQLLAMAVLWRRVDRKGPYRRHVPHVR